MATKNKKTNAQLVAELNERCTELNNLRNIVNQFKREMGELFNDRKRDSGKLISLAEIVIAVSTLKNALRAIETLGEKHECYAKEAGRVLNYENEQELNRLWYMLRVALKDPTLTAVDYSAVDTGNGKPFNNRPHGHSDNMCD